MGDLPAYPLAPTEALPGAVSPRGAAATAAHERPSQKPSAWGWLSFQDVRRAGASRTAVGSPSGVGRRKALAWPGGPPPCFKHHPTPGRGAIYSQMSLGASESLAGLAPGGLTGPQATLLSVGSSWGAVNRDAASWSLRVARASLQRGGPRLRGFLAGDRPVPNERAESRVEAAWPFVTQPPPVSCANFLLFWQSSHMLPWFQGRGTQMPLSMGVRKE